MELRARHGVSRSIDTLRGIVPPELRYVLWQRRALRTVRDGSVAAVEQRFAQIATTIDRDRLRRLHARQRDAPIDHKEACHHELKLRIAIVKAMVMGLHRAPPLRILDLGHGGGYFVITCRHLGHTCDGTEVPVERLPPDAAALYAEITAALGYHDGKRLLIERERPIELPTGDAAYDVICAHKICFNDHRKPTEWGTLAWRYFVEDIGRYLAPRGRLVLELNEHVVRYGALRWYDAALRDYFASVGTVAGNWITIRRNPA
jgi:SAM-dependent methyltransferase